jgi:trigger factor
VKSAVETLNPTRVRLTVEVPFDELRPSLDAAYKRIAGQIVLPGFRRGKVPPKLIDQRFGRGVVLEEAVNEALPRFYSRAIQDNSLQALGQPEVDVTEFGDESELKFTAEVDVRPEFELPPYEGMAVTVPDTDVSDADVDEQITALQERFATLTGVDRPIETGDFVSIDLVAVDDDGEEIDDGRASGMSYEVGSGTMIDGLDEALDGLTASESADFTTTLVGGEHAGEEVHVTVTVRSVKERSLPELDDDFAQTASEFDTVDELRADIRQRLERMRKLEQGVQARDRTLEELLARVDIPLPEGLVQEELAARRDALEQQLEAAGMTLEAYLEAQGETAEEHDAHVEKQARDAIRSQFVLDRIAEQEKLGVSEGELTEHILRRAARSGMSPDVFAQQVVESGQVPVLMSEVVRGKALALVVESANITDESGRSVDLEELREEVLQSSTGETVTVDDAAPADELAAESGQPTDSGDAIDDLEAPGDVDVSDERVAEPEEQRT